MKLSMSQKPQLKQLQEHPRRPKPIRPCDRHKKCPHCGSKELLKIGVDLSCLSCSWDPLEAYVMAGGMDNLFEACIEHITGEVAPLKKTHSNTQLAISKKEKEQCA